MINLKEGNKQNQNKSLNSFIPSGEAGEWKSRRHIPTILVTFYSLTWVMSSQLLVLLHASLLTYTVSNSCLCIKYFITGRENRKGKRGEGKRGTDNCNMGQHVPPISPWKRQCKVPLNISFIQ